VPDVHFASFGPQRFAEQAAALLPLHARSFSLAWLALPASHPWLPVAVLVLWTLSPVAVFPFLAALAAFEA